MTSTYTSLPWYVLSKMLMHEMHFPNSKSSPQQFDNPRHYNNKQCCIFISSFPRKMYSMMFKKNYRCHIQTFTEAGTNYTR